MSLAPYADSRNTANRTANISSVTHAPTAISQKSNGTTMQQSKYPLHPPHAHAAPLYATVPLAEYRALQKKLDICQKECIRIAELYKRDKQLFNTKVKRIIRHINELKKR